MNRENLKAVSDALHNGAEPGDVWGKMAGHTPTPWYCGLTNICATTGTTAVSFGVAGKEIGALNMEHATAASDAELICRAVNAHDELLAALTNALERLEASQPPDGGATFAVVVQCRLALLNAKPDKCP